jgi:hypothetical protein
LELREVAFLASHLPDAGVRLAPDLRHEIGHVGQPAADVAVDPVAGAGIQPRGLQQLAVGVELSLAGRRAADAKGARSAIAVSGRVCSGARAPPSRR